jgi:hypothetical protein
MMHFAHSFGFSFVYYFGEIDYVQNTFKKSVGDYRGVSDASSFCICFASLLAANGGVL